MKHVTLLGENMHVTLKQLQAFTTVARHLSFTLAAKELNLTQPAVSMQVKQLESQIGQPLFEQMGKKIFLTEAGREVRGYARSSYLLQVAQNYQNRRI